MKEQENQTNKKRNRYIEANKEMLEVDTPEKAEIIKNLPDNNKEYTNIEKPKFNPALWRDKEKQIIEELANDIYGSKSCDTSFEENCKLLAYDLVTLGWIKLNENSVVLSKAKYEMLTACSSYEGVIGKLKDEYIRGSKETAEKVIMDFYHELITSFKGRVITYDSFCKIAQKHNIEIPRETFTLAELEAKHEDVEIKGS